LGAATGQFIARLSVSILGWWIAKRRHSNIKWSTSKASSKEMRLMLVPAISFMAFPAGNAISIQGMSLIVGVVFGPVYLAVFNTYRTISRVLVQAITIIGRAFWSEISREYGAGRIDAVMNIYKKGSILSILVSLSILPVMHLFGGGLIEYWTAGRVRYTESIFHLFLLSTLTTSFWQMGMVLLSATNTHSRLAGYYIGGSILSVLFAYSTSELLGESAPVLGILIFEIFMIFACLLQVNKFKTRQGICHV
jgi:O-antigen/teichoic acid export membrane protein